MMIKDGSKGGGSIIAGIGFVKVAFVRCVTASNSAIKRRHHVTDGVQKTLRLKQKIALGAKLPIVTP